MELKAKKCIPCEGNVAALTAEQAQKLLHQVPQWQLNHFATMLEREFQFKNYYQTMAFVNMVAWISHQENHHPDLEVSYQRCCVRYSTHAIKGLSENDFICAAKIDALFNNEKTG